MKNKLKMWSLILIGGIAFVFSFFMCFVGIVFVKEDFSAYIMGSLIFIGGLASLICSVNVWYFASENRDMEERVENNEKE
jgi:hypothetical protein